MRFWYLLIEFVFIFCSVFKWLGYSVSGGVKWVWIVVLELGVVLKGGFLCVIFLVLDFVLERGRGLFFINREIGFLYGLFFKCFEIIKWVNMNIWIFFLRIVFNKYK